MLDRLIENDLYFKNRATQTPAQTHDAQQESSTKSEKGSAQEAAVPQRQHGGDVYSHLFGRVEPRGQEREEQKL